MSSVKELEPLREPKPFGPYLLLRRIATGGMAEIFLAKRANIAGVEKEMVIKRILPHLSENEEFVAMFFDEARIASQLAHPNIVQIYDVGCIDSSYYIAMEYLHGEDLRRIYNQQLKEGARVPLAVAVHLVTQVAYGLDYAHRAFDSKGDPLQLVHRDISPQNILVGFDGHVKIVDFGVAKASNQLAHTRSGVLKGKYSYMSPEQAQEGEIDFRTDVFALGIVLYELTCGVRLFKRENDSETLNAVIACSVRPPSRIVEGYPPELEAILLKTLNPNPARRFQSAESFATALEAFQVKKRMHITVHDIAHYMQTLFSDKLAEEVLMGTSLWEEEHTDEVMKKQMRGQRAIQSAPPTQWDEPSAPIRSPEAESGSYEPSFSTARHTILEFMDEDSVEDTHKNLKPSTLELPEPIIPAVKVPSSAPAKLIEEVVVSPMTPEPIMAASSQPFRTRPLLMAALGGVILVLGVVLLIVHAVSSATATYQVLFDTKPSGAVIVIDGKRWPGKTPLLTEITSSGAEHHYQLELKGFERVEGSFSPVKDKTTIVEHALVPSVH